jgi:hypothetical protein
VKRSERKALAGYLTTVADALMSEMSRDARNYLTGYASAHLAGLAGLLSAADGGDLAGSIAKDREMIVAYVAKLVNGGAR